MKAKLIKTDKDNYILVDSTKGVYDKGYLIGSSRESDVNKLSKQNCDEIFGVVDVEKLADEYGFRVPYDGTNDFYDLEAIKHFKAGFNKAMELNKDKQFTLEDMFNLYAHIVKNGIISGEEANEFIQSLQQPTEIEVEIEMIKTPDAMFQFHDVPYSTPKLDSEGCLILKKI